MNRQWIHKARNRQRLPKDFGGAVWESRDRDVDCAVDFIEL
jgi:hypothetical protein